MQNSINTNSTLAKFRQLSPFWYWVVIILCLIGIAITLNQIFHINLFGITLLENSYIYCLLGVFLSIVFIIFPIKKGIATSNGFPLWIDVVLLALTIGICVTLSIKSLDMMQEGWMFCAPMPYPILGIALWLLVAEALRRSADKLIFMFVLLASLYPLIANYMPGILQGTGFDFLTIVNFHSFSIQSIVGLPMRVFGNLLIGFMIFGVALLALGGGNFFMNLSLSFLGHTRGGPAKVSVAASAFFGSMSGSTISNVITTGSMTIPTMIRTGYPPYFAAAVEACSSTGGVLMPPIMGVTAFIMAMFLSIPYLAVVVAAIVPSILYFMGILIQVDGHAAKNELMGLPREELPSFRKTLKAGWFYLFSLIVLMIFLYLRMEVKAPFYATAFLLICANFRKETRLNLQRIKEFIYRTAQVLAELSPLFAGIGMLIGSMSLTGIAHSLSSEIVYLAGGSLPLMIIFGAFASFALGLGMTITACYIFLAITLAPSLVSIGLNPVAVHLFIMYCGMMSYITPPVCMAIYPAASIAGSGVMKSGITAMRLGSVKYIIPFLFVLYPSMIFQEGINLEVIKIIILALIGVAIMASALEGYLIGIGQLDFNKETKRFKGYLLRCGIFTCGLLIAVPEIWTDLVGLLAGFIIIFPLFIARRGFTS